jgi:hypothetical protein
MPSKKRLITWEEAVACVREGAGYDAADAFMGAIQDIEQASATIGEWERRKRQAVAESEAMVTEWIGADVQFISPSGVIMERQTGAAVSYPIQALIAAGVTDEQIRQAKKETAWATVAAARS